MMLDTPVLLCHISPTSQRSMDTERFSNKLGDIGQSGGRAGTGPTSSQV